jgi:hypothetical protein
VPFTVVVEEVIGDVEAIMAGRTWLTQQAHPCFIRAAPTFAPIAGNAGANHIVPGMLSAPPPWHNVV